ncbi:hypothetical protein DNTS_004985 [Danionella cerebrum]|uniref:Protein kish n=1 Tax=Danionella cerebrum TaxID=2873325 RepID=A0A553RLE3_9TELE|nr:hypothetical protein DNTS_004985 [Danionella translucida]
MKSVNKTLFRQFPVHLSVNFNLEKMTNVYSFDGILVFGLLFICTCAYLKKVPRLNSWLLSEKKGVWGVFYKAAVIGTRLHMLVAASCLSMAFYLVFLK